MIRRTLPGLLTTTGVVATGVVAAGVAVAGVAVPDVTLAQHASAVSEHSTGAARSPGTKITLLTGETVDVSGTGAVVSVTRNGRPVMAAVERGPSGVTVLPPSADRLLASGRVDPALFNVTQLIAQGYDDKRSPELPVIARYRPGSSVRTSGVPTSGVRASSIGPRLTGLKVRRAQGPALWKLLASGAVERLWLDRKLTLRSAPAPAPASAPARAAAPAQTGAGAEAPAAPRAATGKGVRVAVISGGVDATHPDLAGRVVASQNFSYGTGDIDGDGTAIASLIAGSGAASKGKYKGLAPDARIIDAKVFNGGNSETSSLLSGMEWAVRTQKVKVAVLGLGRICRPDSEGDDLVEQAIADLTSATGTLFVAPAADFGHGYQPQSLCSPGTSSVALTAGGVQSGAGDSWSGNGPRKGDHLFKPEISAETKATVARTSTALNPLPGSGPYTTLQSTNASAARVAAAAALLSERWPSWKPAQYKALLTSTAAPTSNAEPFGQGVGIVDAARALRQSIRATAGTHSVSFPAANRKAVSRRVTITNHGKATRTLTVSLGAHPGSWNGPPKKMFTTKTKKLVLKPGRSGTVTVWIDPVKSKAKVGDHVAMLTVSAGKDRLRSVIAAWVRPAARKLTVKATDGAGAPVSRNLRVVNLKSGEESYVDVQNGTGSATLPLGSYVVLAAYSRTSRVYNWMVGAQVAVLDTADRTVTFDGTVARKVVGSVQGLSTVEHLTHAAVWTTADRETVSVSAPGDREYPVFAIPAAHSALTFGLESRLLSSADPRRVAYEVAHVSKGGIPATPTTTQAPEQLAKVVNTLTNKGSATRGGFETTTAIPPDVSSSGMGVGVDFPSQLTVYVTGGFTWDFRVRAYEPGVGDPVRGEKLGLKAEAGRTYEQTWDLPAS